VPASPHALAGHAGGTAAHGPPACPPRHACNTRGGGRSANPCLRAITQGQTPVHRRSERKKGPAKQSRRKYDCFLHGHLQDKEPLSRRHGRKTANPVFAHQQMILTRLAATLIQISGANDASLSSGQPSRHRVLPSEMATPSTHPGGCRARGRAPEMQVALGLQGCRFLASPRSRLSGGTAPAGLAAKPSATAPASRPRLCPAWPQSRGSTATRSICGEPAKLLRAGELTAVWVPDETP
jgi:hypothetical protein